MERYFSEAMEHRRSYYSLTNQSLITDQEIEAIIEKAVRHVPSAFNSQSTRVVLLLGEARRKLWQIVKETLKKVVTESTFALTEKKIEHSFESGYGTVLFFEDQNVVKKLQETFPIYQDRFPDWSLQTSAMHQFAIWTMLEDAGFGASLQHYNPLIDEEVRQTWNLPESWLLIAEMPFGVPLHEPAQKEFQPIEERVRIFNE